MPSDKNNFTDQFTLFKSPWLGRFTFSFSTGSNQGLFHFFTSLATGSDISNLNRVKGLCQGKVLLTKLLKL